MTRHIALYAFLMIPLCAQVPGENIPLQNFEVSEFTKLNTAQRSEIAITGGRAIVHGILTSVGMSYCTIQDPHSFQSITCGFDPSFRAEYYSQRPGTSISLVGVPVVGTAGQLTLSEARVYDANHPLVVPQPSVQNAVMETTNIPVNPGAREASFTPASTEQPQATAPRTNEPTGQKAITEVTEGGDPQFIRRAVPRKEGVGRSASLYVGGTFAQSGDGSASIPTTTAPGFAGSNSLNTRSQGGMTIGAKYSYTMALKNNEGNPQPVMPGFEGELLYSNFNYRGNISNSAATSGEYRSDFDVFALLGNGTIKFNLTPFFPYLGAGAGFAYVSAQNSQLSTNTTGTSQSLRDTDDVTLAGQAFMGVEYILSKDWALFGEYKYLHLQDLNFDHNKTQVDYDFLGLHYLNIGVRNYF
jgi:opacity protein-like surface antigen